MRVLLGLTVDLAIVSAIAHVSGPTVAAIAAAVLLRWEIGGILR